MLPKVNSILYLQVNSIDEEEAKQEYKARIADVNPSYISMEVPIHTTTGKLKRLYAGDQISVYFITEGGVKNYFNTVILGFREEVLRLVIIKLPEANQITQVQRRNFLRVPGELEIAIQHKGDIRFLALTEDVGGGGISFYCDVRIPLAKEDVLNCWLLIPFRSGQVEHANFSGEVVRTKHLESGKQIVMLSFTDIQDFERQKIIKYCFERQLDIRK